MSFFKLIRWQNLLIIALTQYLVRHCLIEPFYILQHINLQMNHLDFALFVLTIVLVSGGGYIINDIFDLNIDMINKPDKIIIGKTISEKKAYLYYYIMNGIAAITGIYLGIKSGSFNLGLVFMVPIMVFYFYSLKYKRLFLWGNFVIALLTGFLIIVVWVFEFLIIRKNGIAFAEGQHSFWIITYFVLAYAFFAFLVTLIREIIKDIEDLEGDSKWGCTTLAVVVGIENAKKIASLISLLGIAIVVFFQIKLQSIGLGYMAAVLMIAVQLPFAYLAYKVWKAKEKADFHFASNISKIIMVFGILTMIGIYFSLQA